MAQHETTGRTEAAEDGRGTQKIAAARGVARTAASPSLTVAAAQFAPTLEKEANLRRIADLVRAAAARGADLVVFPEYSSAFVPELGPAMARAAESIEGPFVAGLAALADEAGVAIVAGLTEASDDPERFHNTLVALVPDRGLAATYRKQHLYDAFGATESRWVVPGELADPEVFDVHGVTVGLQTCYDIRFPEVSRRVTDAGAELICVPAEWVRGPFKEEHWATLLAARAIENTVYVVGAGQTAPGGIGRSMIVDPMGATLASAADGPDAVLAPVSSARVAAVRRTNPSLRARRYRVVPGA